MSSGIVQKSQVSEQEKEKEKGGSTQESARLKLVQRLLASGDNLPAFLQDLLNTQAMVVAGTEAAAFMAERTKDGAKLVPMVHMRPDQAGEEVRKNAINAFVKIISPCVDQNREGAFEVGSPDDAGEMQYCLATVLRADGQAVGVTAVITRCHGIERARQRLASMELVAGYFEIFSMRRSADQARFVASSHQGVLQLMGAVSTIEGFEASCKNICNELATRTGAGRVALGWLKGKNVKVIALSHTEKFDKRQELLAQTKRVMEECLDQEQIVHYDPGGEGTDTVCREAAAYSRQNANCIVQSVPLRRLGEVVGVLMLEYAPDKKPDQNASTMVSLAGDVLTPQIFDRYENDRNIFVKVGASIKHVAKETVGPKHTLIKIIAVGIILILGVLVFYRPIYPVSAPFSFATQDRRAVVAPMEGFIADIGTTDVMGMDGRMTPVSLRPGMHVKAGQTLATMRTTELVLRMAEAQSKANALQHSADQKRDAGKTAESMSDLEEKKAYEAQAALLKWQIEHAEIKAPIDGEIIQGDLMDRRGSPVKEGDMLFEVASLKNLEVEVSVEDRDIQLVHVGQTGEFATTSDPRNFFLSHGYPFTVTRIVPLGEPKDQANIFKVYGAIGGEQLPVWKPGMQGEAQILTEPRSLWWRWTHRLRDYLAIKLRTWL